MYIEIDNHRVRRHDKMNFAVEQKTGRGVVSYRLVSFFDAALHRTAYSTSLRTSYRRMQRSGQPLPKSQASTRSGRTT